MKNQMIVLPRRVKFVANFAAKEAGRYAFNGVSIQSTNGTARAAATDGRTLAMLSWKSDGYFSAILARSGLASAFDLPGHDDITIFPSEDGNFVATVGIYSVKVERCDGGFPPIDYLLELREKDKCTSVFLNSERAAHLLRCLELAEPDFIELAIPDDGSSPIRIRSGQCDCLVMRESTPAWAKEAEGAGKL